MAKITLSQFSFNRGELDPVLHGRSDWKYYYSGAEKLLNLLTRPQGGAVKRGGLRLVAPALREDGPSRLIPFRFSVEQSYILEFGDRRMRVIKDGGVVAYPAGHALAGGEVVVETPYPASALADLRHAQTADVMILTHPGHAPRRLSRHDHHDWRFSPLVENTRTAAPEGLRVTESGDDGARYVVTALSQSGESPPSEITVAANTLAISYDTGGKTFSAMYDWLRARDPAYLPAGINFAAMGVEDAIAFLRGCGYRDRDRGIFLDRASYRWTLYYPDGASGELAWFADATPLRNECLRACEMGWAGNVRATLASQVDRYVADYNAAVTKSGKTRLAWNPVAGATAYRVYREAGSGDSRSFRLLGETAAAAFYDQKLTAQATALPQEYELFTGQDNYPGVCAFFEQRLILGRTNRKPTTFWGSETGVYNSFTRHTPVQDSDSYEFTLSSGEMNAIHWIVPLNDMLLGTSGGEWKAGGGGQAITPTNINARVQSWYGCSPLAPVVVGRTVIFTGRSRRLVRNFAYSLEADGYAGRDLTAYASHLFAGRTIAAMCHQREPSGVVWAVMSDGALLSCTYAPEEDVVAWSRHETAGRFENCCALEDVDGSDQVYFCVARDIGGATRRFIETLEDAADRAAEVEDGFFVDCGLTYRGEPTGRVGGLDHLEGMALSCLADGSVFENLVVRDGAVELPGGFTAAVIHAGLPYSSELTTLELEPEDSESLRNRSRFAVAATVRFVNTRECRYGQAGGSLSEMKFRTTELPNRPIRLFTGEKGVVFATPPGTRAVKLRFVSDAPASFAILGITVEAASGQPA